MVRVQVEPGDPVLNDDTLRVGMARDDVSGENASGTDHEPPNRRVRLDVARDSGPQVALAVGGTCRAAPMRLQDV